MKTWIVLTVMCAALVGCPPMEQPKTLADVTIVATCGEPGEACETEVTSTMDKQVFRDFKLDDSVIRPGEDMVAEDDLLITFNSTEPVKGFVTSESNEVFGETQTYEAVLNEGSSSLAVSYAWKMKIALDDAGQYQLNMRFYGGPDSKSASVVERLGL